MSGKKFKGKKVSKKNQAIAYKSENRWLKNKLRKLEKVLKENPNDTDAKIALEKGLKNQLKYPRK